MRSQKFLKSGLTRNDTKEEFNVDSKAE